MSKLDDIREHNRVKNEEIMKKTEGGDTLVYEDVKEVSYYVPKLYDILKNKRIDKVFFTVYDLPGMNDSQTKNVYFKYCEENFHEFNIVLFVVDVTSALNTSDEMDILKNDFKRYEKKQGNVWY